MPVASNNDESEKPDTKEKILNGEREVVGDRSSQLANPEGDIMLQNGANLPESRAFAGDSQRTIYSENKCSGDINCFIDVDFLFSILTSRESNEKGCFVDTDESVYKNNDSSSKSHCVSKKLRKPMLCLINQPDETKHQKNSNKKSLNLKGVEDSTGKRVHHMLQSVLKRPFRSSHSSKLAVRRLSLIARVSCENRFKNQDQSFEPSGLHHRNFSRSEADKQFNIIPLESLQKCQTEYLVGTDHWEVGLPERIVSCDENLQDFMGASEVRVSVAITSTGETPELHAYGSMMISSDGYCRYESRKSGVAIVYSILANVTGQKGCGHNLLLIFGIVRSSVHGTQHQEVQFWLTEICEPTSEWMSTQTNSLSENPPIYLLAPGPRAYENESSREETFRHVYNLTISPIVLARHGFYWNGNQAQCYSCNSIHNVDDISQHPESNIWHSPTCQLRNRHGSGLSGMRQVASDTPGRISDDIRDPPGQQSIYIPPGDVRVESYRLSTFNNYPVHSPMDKKALAKGGFYFTGYNDRVKCFACGRTVERWEPSDNPLDLRWHKDSCPFPRGGECGNVPSTSLFARLQGSGSGFNPRNTSLEVLEQRDPRTGEYTRTVRYPADLPEHVRRGGGTFEVGRNNSVVIQAGNINRNPGNGESRLRVSTSVNHQPPRQWRMANVISSDHRRFVNNLFLNRELDRLVSFARWPTGRPTVSPTDLARNGFFYLGDMDRTQCFSCAGVLRNWTANDSARVEHRTHFPNCRFILGTENRNVPVPTHPETPQERQRRFPCRFPSNPHMRSEATRLDTFDSRWPMGRMAATPEEIARAGFFFLGERDRVKCWYCNGGLQHWDYDDAPWVEHAKWFPNCQFLLSVKGQHFVYRHLTTSAYLSRPIIARQEGATVDPVPENAGEIPEDIPPEAPAARGPTPPPTIVDPREEMRKKQELVEIALKESDIVKNVLAMGFSVDYVRAALKEKLEGGEAGDPPDIYDTVSGLLEAVMQKETEDEQRRQNEAAAMPGPSGISMPSVSSVYSSMTTDTNLSSLGPAPGSGKYNVSFLDEDDDRDMYGAEPMSGVSSLNSVTQAKQLDSNTPESSVSLQEALNKFEEERMCKICFANQADMVFVPCGHMCCCRNCTEAIRHCPVCRVRIEKAIKTYLE